jgi:hypothetical protein
VSRLLALLPLLLEPATARARALLASAAGGALDDARASALAGELVRRACALSVLTCCAGGDRMRVRSARRARCTGCIASRISISASTHSITWLQ